MGLSALASSGDTPCSTTPVALMSDDAALPISYDESTEGLLWLEMKMAPCIVRVLADGWLN